MHGVLQKPLALKSHYVDLYRTLDFLLTRKQYRTSANKETLI